MSSFMSLLMAVAPVAVCPGSGAIGAEIGLIRTEGWGLP
jgi:hypothetical protein